MADMKSFDEPMPAVGIFWYDPEEHDFFGVYKKELTPKMVEEAADKGLPYINYQTLHRQIWQKQYFKALAENKPTKFKGDYTQVPRGRVSWAVDHLLIMHLNPEFVGMVTLNLISLLHFCCLFILHGMILFIWGFFSIFKISFAVT